MGYRQRRLQFWMRCRERGQIIDSKCDKCQKHITLICQHDKLPLVFVEKYTNNFFSVWILGPWYLKNRINNHVEIFTVSMSSIGIALITSFYVITQPWRQLGAILCFHVIINIFITIHHKLTKFNTHKLQVIL